VAIVIDGVEISTAEDFNKKSAEQTAANRAIEKLMIQNTLT
jgi:dsRNA-specific ribonuclease